MKRKQNFVLFLLIVTAVFFIFGCAADNTSELIAEDYKKMTNDDLLRYYYRLNDEIEKQEKQSGPQVGIGIGGFGRHTGGGVGVSSGATGYTAEELRARRIDVRMELKKRGLTP
ncbi:MAG TPA: hypothetical protein PL134_05850 [Smithellaceae bacterium]|nr:hypothetical protein [Smithellaceae bacterium]HPG53899.1 hypothetical protein [Smithellaceae bacterium]HQB92810.1 hypothetical protein [Smithellaceae bacterium]